MQQEFGALASSLAGGQAADIALDEAKTRPGGARHQRAHLVQVFAVARHEIIQARHVLSVAQ